MPPENDRITSVRIIAKIATVTIKPSHVVAMPEISSLEAFRAVCAAVDTPVLP